MSTTKERIYHAVHKEGWGYSNTSKIHYYCKDRRTSLCGRHSVFISTTYKPFVTFVKSIEIYDDSVCLACHEIVKTLKLEEKPSGLNND